MRKTPASFSGPLETDEATVDQIRSTSVCFGKSSLADELKVLDRFLGNGLAIYRKSTWTAEIAF